MIAPNRLSVVEAIERLGRGDLTAEALMRACLDRAAARADVKAWSWLDPERAIAKAREADRAGRSGPLVGMPIGIKDIIDTVDMPTGHGSPIYANNRPFADAACIALLRMAGGIIMGKTVTTEFANRFPGATVNPHDPGHSPGGSSSGSAAAVADFQVPAALGTQTGGSVIRPSAYCGVVGYKPSFGEFPRTGIKLQSHHMDTLGIICRSVADLPPLRAALLNAPVHRIDRSCVAPRIGVCRTPAWDTADTATQELIESTAARLAAAGARVIDVELATTFAGIHEHHRCIYYFEAARNYAYEYEQHREQVSRELLEMVLTPGRELPLDAYLEALETSEAFRLHLDDIFRDVDVLLTPSATGEAPAGIGSTGSPAFNALWTLGWVPCITLPAGTGPQGLPLGVQLIGQRFRDEALFDTASWVESNLAV
jgi:Asp-tRNA(Asn)/Glu-tRNA(Gln) amidotransferase A subunit family amidase